MKRILLCLSLCLVLSAFGLEASAAEVSTTVADTSAVVTDTAVSEQGDDADITTTVAAQDDTITTEPSTTEPTTTQPEESVKSGFVQLEDGLYYYIPATGEKLVPSAAGVNTIEDKVYLVMADGKIMQYDAANPVVTFGKNKFCLNEDNTLFSGVKDINGKKYSFSKDTYMLMTGWFTDENGKHYASVKSGAMLTGLNKVGGKYYYFTADKYAIKTGWISSESGRRYFKSKTGEMLTGLNKVGGKYYYFNTADGYAKKGWISTKEGKRYFGSKDFVMITGLKKVGGKYYYFNTTNGVMKTGWVSFKEGKRYFSKKTGVMLTGYNKIGGKYYYFNTSNGVMKKGWLTFKQGKRYFDSKGVMLTGINKIGGKSYYFNSSGYMKTGLLTIGSAKYYFAPKTGVMATGWTKVGSKEYYFSSNGKMAKNTIVGKEYVLSNGTKATSKAVKQAVSVVNAVTTKGMSKSEQLRACFNWIVRNCYYQRDYQNPATLKYDWTKTYAQYLFTNKCGNCYKYASAMAYCAKVLGYPSKVAYGKISSGNAMVAHGWAEITINGATYILDPVQQDYSKGNYYMRSYSNYPKRLSKAGTRTIVLS